MYPNEHAGRQTDPKQYDRIRRENDKFGKGIDAIWGIKGDKVELQSIRFDKNKFSPDQAKDWLSKHNFKTSVEPATEKKESSNKYDKIFIKESVEISSLIRNTKYVSIIEDLLVDIKNNYNLQNYMQAKSMIDVLSNHVSKKIGKK